MFKNSRAMEKNRYKDIIQKNQNLPSISRHAACLNIANWSVDSMV